MGNRGIKHITYFENFDALRTILAVYVLLFHYFGLTYTQQEAPSIYYRIATFISRNGISAVSFFFVLSGFLITYLTQKEQFNTDNFNYKLFILKRVLRIWPVYFVVLAIGFIVQGDFHGILNYSTFLANVEVIFRNKSQNGVLFPLWSVSIEEQFYLFFAFIIFFFKILEKNRYYVLFGSILIISLIYQFIYSSDINRIRYSTISGLTDLSIGAIASVLAFNSMKVINFFKNLKWYVILPVYILGAIYLFGRVYLYEYPNIKPIVLSTQHLILSIFFAFIILEQTFSDHSILKFGKMKLLSNYGKYTYGIYMYHSLPIGIWFYIKSKTGWSGEWIELVIVPIFLIIVTSLFSRLSFNFMEKTIMNLKYKLTSLVKNDEQAK